MEILSNVIVAPITRTSSFALTNDMVGLTIIVDSANPVTLTVPTDLPLGFACTIIQMGAGVITFSPVSSSVNIRNIAGNTKSGGQYSLQTILVGATNQPILSGQTAA